MTLINYESKKINFKIIYFGPSQSGKTSNLQCVSRRTPVEKQGGMILLADNADRTTYFDFLPLFLGRIRDFDTRLHLYALPGNVNFDTNRLLIMKGVDGVVFVADARRDRLDDNLESLASFRFALQDYGYDPETVPLVIQYNYADAKGALPVEQLAEVLNPEGHAQFAADAVKGAGVIETLKAISHQVLASLATRRAG
ncbi:MAG: gliding-motility protein MglA [Candidatus Lernaella stagnicola]|nr:gliding-motility protein MglA [Candidatus Lernaella stagnicola]